MSTASFSSRTRKCRKPRAGSGSSSASRPISRAPPRSPLCATSVWRFAPASMSARSSAGRARKARERKLLCTASERYVRRRTNKRRSAQGGAQHAFVHAIHQPAFLEVSHGDLGRLVAQVELRRRAEEGRVRRDRKTPFEPRLARDEGLDERMLR